MIDEKKLVSDAGKGQEYAMEELYRRNRTAVAGLVYRYVGHRQDTEDLLQDIFIRAFSSIGKFQYRPNAGFSSWLRRIAVNTTINFMKKKYRQGRNFTTIEEDIQGPISQGPSIPEKSAISREIQDKVNLGLDSLSPGQRMVFVLKHFHGMNLSEIAGHMGCSEGSVRKQLFRAVEKLRKRLSPHGLGV